MKRIIVLVFLILFVILTICGSIYVLMNHGTVSAGYTVVPCVFAVALSAILKNIKK